MTLRNQSLTFGLSTFIAFTGITLTGCATDDSGEEGTGADTDPGTDTTNPATSTTNATTTTAPSTSTDTDPDTSDTTDTSVTDPSVGPETTESETAGGLSYEEFIQPIFTPSCAIGGCHNGAYPPNLTAGTAYGNLVGAESIYAPGRIHVIPGNSADSYLVTKLVGGDGLVGTLMPQIGSPLSGEQIALIEQWIDEGAAP